MKAISIRQPFSHLVVTGYKDIENRRWNTSYRGPILIHSGLNLHKNLDLILRYCDENNIPLPEQVDCGGIVGIAEIIDVVQRSDSPWFSGPYGFVLANANPLPFFECKGKLGLFDVELPYSYAHSLAPL